MYYDTVRCSYDLGPGFHNRNLHTKELSRTCGCYWINPAGELYEIDYSGTQDFTDTESKPYKSNGQHGRVTPVTISTSIKLQPARWDVHYAKCPTCLVTLMNGKILEYKVLT